MTINANWAEPWDIQSKDDFDAVELKVTFDFGWYGDPLVFGRYPKVMEEFV